MMKINSNYVMKDIDNGVLLINVTEGKEIYKFNNIARIILNNIQKSKNEIVELICMKYGIDSNTVSDDYDNFIKQLLKEKILVVSDEN